MVFNLFIFLFEPPVFQRGKPSDFLSLWHQGISGDQDNVWCLVLLLLLLLFCLFVLFLFFCCCFNLFHFVFCFVLVLFCFDVFCLFFVFLFVFLIYFQVLASNKLNFFLLLISFPAEVSSPRCL